MKRVVFPIEYRHQSQNIIKGVAYGLNDECLVYSQTNPVKDGRWLSGGPFYVRKRRYDASLGSISYRSYGYDELSIPIFGYTSTSQPAPLTRAQLQSDHASAETSARTFGSTGWARARPGNPVASVFQTGVELYRDVPSIPLRLFLRLKNLNSVGSEYLNVQFGWMPLLNDIRKMYKLYHDIDKRLAQLVRENGKGIRRRRTIRETTNVTSTTQSYNTAFQGCGSAPSFPHTGKTVITTTTTVTEKIWFAGRFRYYVPDIGSSQWTSRARRVLWGVNPTPHAVYSVVPWSWLIGWFSNVGDVVSNASTNAVDNLTADYAFIMRQNERLVQKVCVTSWNQYGNPNGSHYCPAGSMTLVGNDNLTTKLRTMSTPFGFGVTFDGLSPYQASIAAALGISRTRF